MDQDAILALVKQLIPFVPVVVGLFFALVFFFVAIRLLMRSNWETDRQPFLTGILFVFLGCWAASGTAGMSSALCEMTGLLLVLGMIWYSRWLFAEWLRGYPVVGERYTVLGIGEVTVTDVYRATGSDAHEGPVTGLINAAVSPRVKFEFGDGEEPEVRDLSVLTFRFKSTLMEPKAKRRLR